MADYKEMYLTLFRAVEKATDILIDAQQKCEDLYINAPETIITVFKSDDKNDDI